MIGSAGWWPTRWRRRPSRRCFDAIVDRAPHRRPDGLDRGRWRSPPWRPRLRSSPARSSWARSCGRPSTTRSRPARSPSPHPASTSCPRRSRTAWCWPRPPTRPTRSPSVRRSRRRCSPVRTARSCASPSTLAGQRQLRGAGRLPARHRPGWRGRVAGPDARVRPAVVPRRRDPGRDPDAWALRGGGHRRGRRARASRRRQRDSLRPARRTVPADVRAAGRPNPARSGRSASRPGSAPAAPLPSMSLQTYVGDAREAWRLLLDGSGELVRIGDRTVLQSTADGATSYVWVEGRRAYRLWASGGEVAAALPEVLRSLRTVGPSEWQQAADDSQAEMASWPATDSAAVGSGSGQHPPPRARPRPGALPLRRWVHAEVRAVAR